MNKEKLINYILMKREKEMGVEFSEDRQRFYNEMENIINNDPTLKNQISLLLQADSMRKTNDILSGRNSLEETDIMPIDEMKQEVEPTGGESISNIENPVSSIQEQGKQYTLNKRAGFVDVLVMALVTGFISGIATTILFILI